MRSIVVKQNGKAVAADGSTIVVLDTTTDPPTPIVLVRELAGAYEVVTCEDPAALRDALDQCVFPSQLKVTPPTDVVIKKA